MSGFGKPWSLLQGISTAKVAQKQPQTMYKQMGVAEFQ